MHSDDGRYIVVDGRRWRASDPSIPEKFRAELVAELMTARRAVKSNPETARPRVQDAKIALGERGRPWWQEPTEHSLHDAGVVQVMQKGKAVDPRAARGPLRIGRGLRWS